MIFSMLASFHTHRDSPTLDAVATHDAPDPESLAAAADGRVARRRPRGHADADRRGARCVTRIASGCAPSAPLPDDPLVHACALAYASDLGSGFGQVEIPGLPTGGPSIDHAVWFHAPLRADEWMLLELAPRKARSSRGVYDGSLRNADGELGALIVQETLLRDFDLDDESLARVADFLGVTRRTERSDAEGSRTRSLHCWRSHWSVRWRPAAGAAPAGRRRSRRRRTAITATPARLRVAIAGDSITALSRDRIVAALTDRYRVRVNAYSGRTIAEVTPAIGRQVATHPDVEVVNLGTNDLDHENPHWRADLDRMLRLVAGVPCVAVVHDLRRSASPGRREHRHQDQRAWRRPRPGGRSISSTGTPRCTGIRT